MSFSTVFSGDRWRSLSGEGIPYLHNRFRNASRDEGAVARNQSASGDGQLEFKETAAAFGSGLRGLLKTIFLPGHESLVKRFRLSINNAIQTRDDDATTGTLDCPSYSWNFREGVKIPYIKRPFETFLYPHAEIYIPQEHRNRYPQLVNILKQAVEHNPSLARDRNWTAGTAYTLAMCGKDMNSAVPSVVVFCPGEDTHKCKQLQRTLSQDHVAAQYNGPSTPRFQVYIWAISFTLCGRSGDNVDIVLGSPRSMCGAGITNGVSSERLCTVAALLSIGSRTYALTSAHTFDQHNTASAVKSSRVNEPYAGTQTSPEVCEENEALLSGVDYCFEGEDVPRVSKKANSRNLVETGGRTISCHVVRVPNEARWTDKEAHLDFALLRLPEEARLLGNTYQVDHGNKCDEVHVKHEPRSRPNQSRQVCIITSNGITKSGNIQPVPAYISNSSRTDNLCEIWVVSLVPEHALGIGDSGSLVVDAEDSRPYGHVIATDPLGRLYVVPLQNVLHQIRKMFSSDAVGMFSPQGSFRPATRTARFLKDRLGGHKSFLEWMNQDFLHQLPRNWAQKPRNHKVHPRTGTLMGPEESLTQATSQLDDDGL